MTIFEVFLSVLVVFQVCKSEDNQSKLWFNWLKTFNKSYSNPFERLFREATFYKNLKLINEHNSKNDITYTLKINQFADLTFEEFQEMYLLPKKSDSIDWTNYQGTNYVPPVHNQGGEGNSEDIMLAQAMSANGYILCGNQNILSVEELDDCTTIPGQFCSTAVKLGGLCLESEYKSPSHQCESDSCSPYNPISNCTYITPRNTEALEQSLGIQTVITLVDASSTAFQFYASGILTGNCGTNLDHALLTVGYGTESGNDYWKAQNDWGINWGEQGYIRLCRNCNKNNGQGQCGILEQPFYPDMIC